MFLLKILLAGIAGVCGCLISGLDAFILYGALVILEICLRHLGVDTTVLKTYGVDLFFVPCVMFNATCAAAGYASKKGKMKAWDIQTRMWKFHDPIVFLIGFGAGILGYLVMWGLNTIHFPVDTGALSITLTATLYRFLFPRKRLMNKSFRFVLSGFWWLLKEMLIAVAVCVLTVLVYRATNELNLCFAISAVSLQLQKHTKLIPTTHQISICAAYACATIGGFLPAILAGLAAHLIFVLFSGFFNMECGTHIDGPAVAIAMVSFAIFF